MSCKFTSQIYRLDTICCFLLLLCLACSCSTVSRLPQGEVLYTGTRAIKIAPSPYSPLLDEAVSEARVAFVSPPNNALFGSSRYRIPFPLGLWTYNAFYNDSTRVGRWLFRAFAATPVLVSSVNPALRASVARNTLYNYGYFDGNVSFSIDTISNGREAMVSYLLSPGEAWYLGSVDYRSFPLRMDSLLHFSRSQSLLYKGMQFDFKALSGERNRIFNLFREHGYYYFRPDMVKLYADTLQQRGRVQLRVQVAESLPQYAIRPWYIGNLVVNNDSLPVCANVLEPRIAFHRGELYSSLAQNKTQRELNRLGVFSSVGISLSPRDSSMLGDTLDVYITALSDKPYEVSVEANLTAKSGYRIGPGLVAAFSRKNRFRMAETIQLRLKGSYEWYVGRTLNDKKQQNNSFEIGADASLSVPDLLWGNKWSGMGSTSVRLYGEWLARGGFFRMLAFGGNITYGFATNDVLTHTISPLRLSFNTLEHTTPKFDSIMTANPAIGLSFRDQFVPSMNYIIGFDNTSRTNSFHTSKANISLTSAGAITSTVYALCGEGFGKRDKGLLGTPFAQFLKISAEMCHYYRLFSRHVIATRFMGGLLYAYGNSEVAPYVEQFYVGGATGLRAFPLRGIGPGSYHSAGKYAYIDHTGDFKLEANVEWRFPLVGNLDGALFVDAGNVWLLHNDASRPGGALRMRTLGRDIALGTGIGLRYNLKMLLVRADIGIPLHVPYDTGIHKYYNVPNFWRGLCIHLGVGYPF